MLKLHRLKIERFRTVKPCELYFNDGMNILLGRNGSGKTTLLKLITALYTSPIGEILPGEEYEIEVEFRFSVGSIISYIKRDFPKENTPSGVAFGVSENTGTLELRVHIEFGPSCHIEAKFPHPDFSNTWLVKQNQNQTNWVLKNEQMAILNLLQIFVNGMMVLDIPQEVIDSFARDLMDSVLPFRLDESLEALDFIHESKIGFNLIKGQISHISLIDGPFPVGYVDIFHGKVAEESSRSSLAVDDRSIDFLKLFTNMTGLQSARLVCERIESIVRSESRNSIWNLFGHFRFSFTRRDGSEFWQEQLSYGQKRLLVFLYYVSAVPQVIISDELVNGLHHEWIEACVKAMHGKQAFLTSQNPLLLDHLSFESQEGVRKNFLLCSATPQPNGDVMQWKNMSEAEAEIFYQAYQVGIQHVSEILHSEGLW